MKIQERIEALRKCMKQAGMWAYIVPGNDPHASEYMASHWMEITWITGFNGETGTVVITPDKAKLFTDSRYYLQAELELKGTGVELMRASDIDCPSINQWLISEADNKQGLVVGVNPEMWSVNDFASLQNSLSAAQLKVKSKDLISPLWTDKRPPIPSDPLYAYSEKFAGESATSKIDRIRTIMRHKGAGAMLVSALDEIAWLLNIRGNDVAFNPVVISYLVLEKGTCTLFVNPQKVSKKAANYLESIKVQVRPYDEVFNYVKALTCSVLIDGNKVNEALREAIPNRIINCPSPIQYIKSHKNEVELEGERKAMLQDAIALCKFFIWLDRSATRKLIAKGQLTEYDLMCRLHEFRAERENFVEESFETIAGFNANGAIVHYTATKENCATIQPVGMLLLDSGGQYLDGTTDITRTIWLGDKAPKEAKRDYTLVLKGHIALATIRWPRGTRGNQLDALAKQYMWKEGITFGHGTGHGVGHFLGCHEGPQNVRTDMNPTPLEAGQICSDEPGIYRTDKWGVRIENLLAVRSAKKTAITTTDDEWFEWETLTLCPYDKKLIDKSLLTEEECRWLNQYHKRVVEALEPYLSSTEMGWLRDKCHAIKKDKSDKSFND